MIQGSLKEISGITFGQFEDPNGGSGVTAVFSEEGVTPGVDVRGGAPGTRETDLISSSKLVDRVHAVFLSGGSAFGLDAGSGIMRRLEEEQIGFDVGVTKVPIVTGAVLFDLTTGDPYIRPSIDMGYEVANRRSHDPPQTGNRGAGTGATVGKYAGNYYAMKGGLGQFTLKTGNLIVGCLIAVNCLGDVIDPKSGKILAGAYDREQNKFLNTERLMIERQCESEQVFSGKMPLNTCVGTVITNANLRKASASKVASMAHNGLARTITPSHTMMDGDTIFCLASGAVEADINTVGLLAKQAVEKAVIEGVTAARSAYGYVSYNDI